MNPDQLPLPGMDDAPDTSVASQVELGVRRTIAALHADGVIVERDAGKLALAVSMAKVIEAKQRSGRMSTIGHDARVLLDVLESLTPDATEVDDELAAAMRQWEAAAQSPALNPTTGSGDAQ